MLAVDAARKKFIIIVIIKFSFIISILILNFMAIWNNNNNVTNHINKCQLILLLFIIW
jgi:hypothetical protein